MQTRATSNPSDLKAMGNYVFRDGCSGDIKPTNGVCLSESAVGSTIRDESHRAKPNAGGSRAGINSKKSVVMDHEF